MVAIGFRVDRGLERDGDEAIAMSSRVAIGFRVDRGLELLCCRAVIERSCVAIGFRVDRGLEQVGAGTTCFVSRSDRLSGRSRIGTNYSELAR